MACILIALCALLLCGCRNDVPQIALDFSVGFPAAAAAAPEQTELPGVDLIPEIPETVETVEEVTEVPRFGIVCDAGAEEDFPEMISRADVTVIDFTADWCGPCQRLLPEIERMASEMPNVCFVTVDIGKCRTAVAQAGGVVSVPCVRVYAGGKAVGRESRLTDTGSRPPAVAPDGADAEPGAETSQPVLVGEVVGNYPARLEGLIKSTLRERGGE